VTAPPIPLTGEVCRGETATLAWPSPEEIDRLVALRNRPSVRRWFLDDRPVDLEKSRAMLGDVGRRPRDGLLAVRTRASGRLLGALGWSDWDWAGGSASVGRVMIDFVALRAAVDAGETGAVSPILEAARTMRDFAFQTLGVRTLRSFALCGNAPAEQLNAAIGMIAVGSGSATRPDGTSTTTTQYALDVDRWRTLVGAERLGASAAAPRGRRLRVALFAHRFLGPTHHAVAQMLAQAPGVEFLAFAKKFEGVGRTVGNVVVRETCRGSRVPRSLARREVDVVHSLSGGRIALLAGAAAEAIGRPLIVSFQGGADVHARLSDPRHAERMREVLRRAAGVTVGSESAAEILRGIGHAGRVCVVPVAIDVLALPPRGPVDPRRVVCVGRFVAKKGIDVALRTLALLPSEYVLEIVGDGPQDRALRRLAKALGVARRVTWRGLLPYADMLDALARSATLLHAARVADDGNAEGTPQVVINALAIGTPVVATATGAIADVVRDGVHGRVVATEYPAAAAAAVREISESPRWSGGLPDAVRNEVRRAHSVRRAAESIGDLYLHALSG